MSKTKTADLKTMHDSCAIFGCQHSHIVASKEEDYHQALREIKYLAIDMTTNPVSVLMRIGRLVDKTLKGEKIK